MIRFRVKELARAKGMTTEGLARKSGLKMSTVRNVWQNAVKDPSYSTMAALARALEVRIEDLVEEVPDEQRTPTMAAGTVPA